MKNELKLRIMSFNIRYDNNHDGINLWLNRKNFVFETLNEINPDIMCLQEVLPHIRVQFENEFNSYSFCGCGRDENLLDEANLILYKRNKFDLIFTKTFWLSSDSLKPGSFNPYSVDLPRICTTVILREKSTQKIFTIYNTHLDHISDKSRIFGTDVIFDYITKNDYFNNTPIFITGDFNCIPDSAEINHFNNNFPLNYKFKDVVDLTNCEYKYTYTDFTHNEPDIKIDYIYITEDIKLNKFEMITKWRGEMALSDHFPVVADVIL